MRLPLVQDPAGHFDYATLTWIHNTAYDGMLAFVLTTGWFFALALAGFILAARRLDPGRFSLKTVHRLCLLAAALLILPIAGSAVIEKQGGPADSMANFAGHLKGRKTADYDGEFTGWAKDRYGLELSPAQARELRTKESRGLFVPTTQTRPVIHDGALIHGIIAADQIILVDKTGSELPMTAP